MSKSTAIFTHFIATALDNYVRRSPLTVQKMLLGDGGHLEMVEFAHACAKQLEDAMVTLNRKDIPMSIWCYQILEVGAAIPAMMLEASAHGFHMGFVQRWATASAEERPAIYMDELVKILAGAPNDFTKIAGYLQQLIAATPPARPLHAPAGYVAPTLQMPSPVAPFIVGQLVQMSGQLNAMAMSLQYPQMYPQHYPTPFQNFTNAPTNANS